VYDKTTARQTVTLLQIKIKSNHTSKATPPSLVSKMYMYPFFSIFDLALSASSTSLFFFLSVCACVRVSYML
jgi:hypothetical protein